MYAEETARYGVKLEGEDGVKAVRRVNLKRFVDVRTPEDKEQERGVRYWRQRCEMLARRVERQEQAVLELELELNKYVDLSGDEEDEEEEGMAEEAEDEEEPEADSAGHLHERTTYLQFLARQRVEREVREKTQGPRTTYEKETEGFVSFPPHSAPS